jgi:hypothetical protein
MKGVPAHADRTARPCPVRLRGLRGGVRQVPGRDFKVEGRSLVFPRPLAQEGKLGFWRWTSMWLGIAGTYRKHETVDIAYEANGRREVETGLEPQPYDSD